MTVAITNFFLFFIIAILIGGDAVNGHIENGHYYLADHGIFTEVSYFVFMYSELHFYSLLITHPLGMLAGFLYWMAGGASFRPESQAVTYSPTTNSNIFVGIKSLLWKVADLIDGFFWMLFDSWRKPDCELFVRQSQQECIQNLYFATEGTDHTSSIYKVEKPVWGYFSGNHFYLQKWNYNPLLRDGGKSTRPILVGKFFSTPQGTYIRLWHRFPTGLILFFTIWFGTVISILSYSLISNSMYSTWLYAISLMWIYIIAFLLYASVLFIVIFIGSYVGKANNSDIIEFVKNALDHHQKSSQLMGFRLSRKMQGKV